MFTKYYKIHTATLILGLISFFINFLMLKVYNESKFALIFQVTTILFFIITLCCYYKIIFTFNKVTDISKMQVFLAMLSHSLTLVAICFWHYAIVAVPMAFIGSIVIRRWAGIRDIDEQMKELCNQLDFELYKIGKEQKDEEKH